MLVIFYIWPLTFPKSRCCDLWWEVAWIWLASLKPVDMFVPDWFWRQPIDIEFLSRSFDQSESGVRRNNIKYKLPPEHQHRKSVQAFDDILNVKW